MTLFTRRAFVPERMDEPDVDPGELDVALRFIRTVNARLGGTAALLGHLRRWTRDWPSGRALHVLDLGTGSADIPIAVVRWCRERGRPVRVVAVDNHPRTLEAARRHLDSAPDARDAVELVLADARTLAAPIVPAPFDVVHAGMFLHHLPDLEIVTVLRIMQRLASTALVWNDLTRDAVSRAAIRVLTMGTSEMVRHDAIVSVAKGFARREAIDLARRAGLDAIAYRRHLFGRFTLTAPGTAAPSRSLTPHP